MRSTVRGKMMALIALPTLIIYVVVLGLMMVHLRGESRLEVEEEMTRLAANWAARFDGAFREAAAIALSTARFMESQPDPSQEAIFEQLRSNTLQNPVVYGAAMAFEPGTYTSGDELFCPYVFRGPDGLETKILTREILDWYGDEQWQWWHVPKATGHATWTDPYFDEGAGNELMVTFAAPFFRNGSLRGVTTIDIMLPTLQESVGEAILSDVDFVILTRQGQYVWSPVPSAIMAKTVFDRAHELGRLDIAEAARPIVSGQSGAVTLDAWEEREGRQWVFYAPIDSTGWAFAAIVSEHEALAGVNMRMKQGAVALAATLGLIIGCIWYVSGRITRPIGRLRAKVLEIAGGDLDARIEDLGADEIGDLARSFNTMTTDLKTHIERIGRLQAASRDAVIFAMAKLAESRDTDTGQHLERICTYVEILATNLAKSRPEIDAGWIQTVTLTAALHDIGKVGIPDAVLCKPGKLTDEERQVIQKHTTIGGDTLLALKRRVEEDSFLETATEIAFAHHERWDGTGYPFGLAKDDIAFAARIVAVADVYDAITCERVYKKAMPHEKARNIIIESSGSHFDPTVVEAFIATETVIQAAADKLRGDSATGR